MICSATPVDTTQIIGIQMDLPEKVPAGTYLKVFDTIRNQGSSSTGQFSLAYYLSGDLNTDIPVFLGVQEIMNLVPGGQKTLNFSVGIPPNLNPGTYHLERMISDKEQVLEPDNFIPDLYGASRIEVSEFNKDRLIGYFTDVSTELSSRETISICSDISNTDDVEAILAKISYYVSKTGLIGSDIIYLGDSPEIGIEPNSEIQETSILHLNENISDGEYYLIAAFLPIEYSKEIPGLFWVSDEPIEIRNLKTSVEPTRSVSQLNPPSGPDVMTVKTEYPDVMYIGDSVKLSDSIQNIGDSTAGIVRVEYLLSPNNDGSDATHLDWWTLHNMNPGETRSSQVIVGVPSQFRSGIYYVTKKITITSSVPETNTLNNFWTGNRPVRVEYNPSSKIPDLTHIRTKFPCGEPGNDVEIIDTITNVGNACTDQVSVAYYISPYLDFDPSTAIYLGVWKINRICVGEQVTQTTMVKIPIDLEIGEYYWYSVIDPCTYMPYCGDEIPEIDKSNNINIGRLTIGPCIFCSC